MHLGRYDCRGTFKNTNSRLLWKKQEDRQCLPPCGLSQRPSSPAALLEGEHCTHLYSLDILTHRIAPKLRVPLSHTNFHLPPGRLFPFLVVQWLLPLGKNLAELWVEEEEEFEEEAEEEEEENVLFHVTVCCLTPYTIITEGVSCYVTPETQPQPPSIVSGHLPSPSYSLTHGCVLHQDFPPGQHCLLCYCPSLPPLVGPFGPTVTLVFSHRVCKHNLTFTI